MKDNMYKTSLVSLNLIICVICAAFAAILYIFEIHAMANMFIAALCLFVMILIIPLSISRMNRDLTPLHNFVIFLSSTITMMLLLFLIVTFVYLGLFKAKMFGFFEVVFYPATLAILLCEFTISYFKKIMYKNSINQHVNSNMEDE